MTREKWCIMCAARIRSRMDYIRMTREEFTTKLGVSNTQVSRWLSGGTVPKATDIVNIAKVLNCSVSWLIDYSERVE